MDIRFARTFQQTNAVPSCRQQSDSGPLRSNALEDSEQRQDDAGRRIAAAGVARSRTEQQGHKQPGDALVGSIHKTAVRPLVVQDAW